MTQIISYLTFNGNCREAMVFYQACLGGELSFQTVGDSPVSGQMPLQMREFVLHSELTKGSLKLMATDMAPENGVSRGNGVSMYLQCEDEATCRSCFEKLSAGGKTTQALTDTFWGALFGHLTDKYGNQWMLSFDKSNLKK